MHLESPARKPIRKLSAQSFEMINNHVKHRVYLVFLYVSLRLAVIFLLFKYGIYSNYYFA